MAVGLRVKTGKAAGVVVGWDGEAPVAFERRALELYDREVPWSWQPYHAALERTEAEGRRIVERATRSANAVAVRVLAFWIDELRKSGRGVRAMGIVVGSLTEPAAVANPHMRAHASEGKLYREAVRLAAEKLDLSLHTFVERTVYDDAARLVGRPVDEVRRLATELGRSVGPPWRADEKTAAVSAWAVLRGQR